jgi:hypothetical protein
VWYVNLHVDLVGAIPAGCAWETSTPATATPAVAWETMMAAAERVQR